MRASGPITGTLCQQTTPKTTNKFREVLTQAPRSLKQSVEEESNNEVLNICCGGFNSVLFLTPPKIRSATGEAPTPSPAKQEGQGLAETRLEETALSKDLMDVLNSDFEAVKITAPAPVPATSSALQNITNREQYDAGMKDTDSDCSAKKRSGKSQFKFPDGGWVCLACQNYNFCGRVRCNRCGKNKTKDDPVGKPKHLLRKENDENDPTLAGKIAAKPAKKQLRERAGDWLCLSCRNINFAFRQQCNRCKLNKELIGSTLDPHGNEQVTGWNGVYPPYCPTSVPFEYAQYAMLMQNQQLAYPSGL